uniref:Uncharacterized protein n=1 Tax=Esox lucius TaxID=8010 RepID=A0A3P8XW63_ESOLU
QTERTPVRYCLKTLREQMAARQNSTNKKVVLLLKANTVPRYVGILLIWLPLQAESNEFRRRLDERSERLKLVEGKVVERDKKVEELERLLGGMEREAASLRDNISASEAELLQWRAAKEEGELEKELAVLKQKIHHLDDMLKCQQRKVRHMIEQVRTWHIDISENPHPTPKKILHITQKKTPQMLSKGRQS